MGTSGVGTSGVGTSGVGTSGVTLPSDVFPVSVAESVCVVVSAPSPPSAVSSGQPVLISARGASQSMAAKVRLPENLFLIVVDLFQVVYAP